MDISDGAAGLAIVKALADKLRRHEVRAVESAADYEALRAAKKDPEFALACRYIRDAPLRKWCLEGLLLRSRQADREAVQDIKDRLRRKKGPDAVWIAEAMQIGLVKRLIGILEGTGSAPDVVSGIVTEYLLNVRRRLLLVQYGDNVEELVQRALTNIRLSPLLYCIAGSGGAVDTARKVVKEVYPAAFDYAVEPEDGPNRFTAFFIQKGPGERGTRHEGPLPGYEVP